LSLADCGLKEDGVGSLKEGKRGECRDGYVLRTSGSGVRGVNQRKTLTETWMHGGIRKPQCIDGVCNGATNRIQHGSKREKEIKKKEGD